MKRNAKIKWDVPPPITRRKFDQLLIISAICHCRPTKPSHYKAHVFFSLDLIIGEKRNNIIKI